MTTSKDSYNAVGAAEAPRLGVGQPEGLARPGGINSASGAPSSGDIPKVARPGGSNSASGGGGEPPKVARPGGPQSAS